MRYTTKNTLILIFLITSCTNSGGEIGRESNPQRKTQGIPIIEKGWIADTEKIDESAYVVTWKDSEQNLQNEMVKNFESSFLPHHTQKSIYVKNEIIQSEADIYTNGSDDKIMYSLTIKHNHFEEQKEPQQKDGEWEASLGENHNSQVIRNREKSMMSLALLAEQGKIDEKTAMMRMDSIKQIFDNNYRLEDRPLQKISIFQADSIMKKWGISRF